MKYGDGCVCWVDKSGQTFSKTKPATSITAGTRREQARVPPTAGGNAGAPTEETLGCPRIGKGIPISG